MTATHSPILSPEALSRDLDRPDIRIVDVRWVLNAPGAGRAAYEAGHIPGAIFLDLDTDLAAPEGPGRHPLPSPAAFRERLEAAGIGSDDTVVAYDDTGGATAARLWWMLDDLGHERVAILDGGYPAWVAAGYPVSTTEPEPRPRGHLELRDAWTRVTDRDAVAAGLGTFVLLDARAGPRYRGEVEPVDRVPGHIPTARSAPSAQLPRTGWAIARRRGPRGPVRDAGRRRVERRVGRDLVWQRRHGLPHEPRDAHGRPAGPDPLPRFLLGLVQRRPADRHRPRAGRPTRPDLGRPTGDPDLAAVAAPPTRDRGEDPSVNQSGPRERSGSSRVDSVVIGR